MPLNVLLVSQEYPPAVGGAGVVAEQNARGLAARGHQVTVVTRKWGPPEEPEGLYVIQVGGGKFWRFLMAKAISRLPLDKYDVIVLNDIGAAVVVTSFFPWRRYRRKLVVYLHGGEPESVFQRPCGFVGLTEFYRRYSRLLRRAACIIPVSQYMKKYFLRTVPALVNEDKVEVVYAGVDETVFYPVKSNIRSELNLTGDDDLLLTVGRVIKEKGFARMLDVFNMVSAERSNLYWCIVGDGPYLNTLRKNIRDAGLEHKVLIAGPVDRDKVPLYLSAGDLFWLLSEREAEAFGLVYVEAEMCGCPAMGPRRFGVREAIQHDVSGFLVQNAQEARDIITQRRYLQLDENAILDYSRRYSLRRQVRRLEEILHVVAAGGSAFD